MNLWENSLYMNIDSRIRHNFDTVQSLHKNKFTDWIQSDVAIMHLNSWSVKKIERLQVVCVHINVVLSLDNWLFKRASQTSDWIQSEAVTFIANYKEAKQKLACMPKDLIELNQKYESMEASNISKAATAIRHAF